MEKEQIEGVCQAVKAYFRYKNMTLTEVAERLEATPRAVSAQLAGRPFSRKTAERYAQLFGFSPTFLLTGEGELLPGEKLPDTEEQYKRLLRIIESQQDTIHLLARLAGTENGKPPHHCEG